jgi:ferrous iron transport protein A
MWQACHPGRLCHPDLGLTMRMESMEVTLDKCVIGAKARVVAIAGGRGVVSKLSAQGIVPGAVVHKTAGLHGGPVVVRVGRSQVALGRGLAQKVVVEAVSGEVPAA